jgi:phosphate transport system substrate-binding protein
MLSRIVSRRYVVLASLAAFIVGLASCQSPSSNTPQANQGTPPQTSSAAGTTITLNGAGGTFPAPLYQKWFVEYNKEHPDVQVSYQGVGSGAGIEQFTKGTVDFGASDVAMKDEQIAQVPKEKGVLLLPMTAGSIVLSYNLPSVKSSLKLSRDVYSDIFLGKITQWNDPKIKALNPGVDLPNDPITVVHRSDGSGTTGAFTRHLSAISPAWKSGPGQGTTVSWPVGNGGKGNDGVTAVIQQTEGAIGYVEYGYASQNNLPMTTLENKAGSYVAPTLEDGATALSQVKLPDNLRAFIADPEGKTSYPIVTYTWILAYKNMGDANKAKALKDVLKWGLTDGQKFSKDLGYIPLPESVANRVEQAVEQISS